MKHLVKIHRNDINWVIDYKYPRDKRIQVIYDVTEANARAKMIIHLIKN